MTTITWNHETNEIVHISELSVAPAAWADIQDKKDDSPYVVYRFYVQFGDWYVVRPKDGFNWKRVEESEIPDVCKLAGSISDF